MDLQVHAVLPRQFDQGFTRVECRCQGFLADDGYVAFGRAATDVQMGRRGCDDVYKVRPFLLDHAPAVAVTAGNSESLHPILGPFLIRVAQSCDLHLGYSIPADEMISV
jgi:hypothetical protein